MCEEAVLSDSLKGLMSSGMLQCKMLQALPVKD